MAPRSASTASPRSKSQQERAPSLGCLGGGGGWCVCVFGRTWIPRFFPERCTSSIQDLAENKKYVHVRNTAHFSTSTPFVWLISHQPAVLFSQNKPATSNQPTVLFSQNKSAPAINHQPNELAAQHKLTQLSIPSVPLSVLARARRAQAPPPEPVG
jgi:hypothetical protein